MLEPGAERRKFFMDLMVNEKYQVNPDHLYKPQDGDVIIVGPPKSGSTWLQQMCHQIRTKGDDTFDDIYDVTWYIPHPTGTLYDLNGEQVCRPRIYKHHEVYGVIETTEKQKHILMFRDPYDTTLSWMKYHNRWYGGDEDMDENETVELYENLHRSKKLSIFNTLSSWWSHRDEPNVLQLFYEDAVARPRNFIKEVADFLSIELTDDELDRICHFCSFQWMEENKKKFRNDNLIASRALAAGVEKWTPKMGMVRSDGGQIGQGKRQLGEKLKSTIDKLWDETMGKLYGIRNYQEMYNTYGLFNNKFVVKSNV